MAKDIIKNKSKKQRVIGTQNFLNQTTGEVEEFVVVDKIADSDFNFHKVWMQDILNILDTWGNKKMRILSHLLSIMRNTDNTFETTQGAVADAIGVSRATVNIAFREMLAGDVFAKLQTPHCYMFNPDILVKGSYEKHKNLLVRYVHKGKDDKTLSDKAAVTKEINQTINNKIAYLQTQKIGASPEDIVDIDQQIMITKAKALNDERNQQTLFDNFLP